MKPDDPKIAEWLDDINEKLRKDMLPKMRSSKFCMGIVDEHLDAYMLMQVGAALLLEKPLLLIVLKGSWVPKKARELADEIVEVETLKTDEAKALLQAAIGRMMEKQRRERQQQ